MSIASSSTFATTAAATTRRSGRSRRRCAIRRSTGRVGCRADRPDHVLGRRQLRDRPRAGRPRDVRRRGHGRQPEPVRRRPAVALPYGGQSVFVATRYWQRSTPDDPRITIEPESPPTSRRRDYFAGRDPVLQAILAADDAGCRPADAAGRAAILAVATIDAAGPDLLVRGGTVVTAAGSRRADVAVRGGRIEAVEPDLAGLAARRARSSTRPGSSSCPAASTSTPTRGSPPTPSPIASSRTRSLRPSAARRRSLRSTTREPARRRRRIARSWPGSSELRRATASTAPRLRPQPGDLGPDGRPAGRAAGDGRCRHPDGEGVHGVRLPARPTAHLRGDAGPGRARRDAPGPLRGPGPDRRRGRRGASAW